MKIIQAFIKFFKKLIENYKTKRLIKKLEPIVQKKVSDRTSLRYDITAFILKYRRLHKSLYIPLDWKTKEIIKYNVEQEFGEEMAKLNLRLNNKLQVV